MCTAYLNFQDNTWFCDFSFLLYMFPMFLYMLIFHHFNLSFFASFLFHTSLTALPHCAFFLSLCGGPSSRSMPLFVCLLCCRWFIITPPCFSRACAQKQCVRGRAWYRSLISRSEAKGWVITACTSLRLNRGRQHLLKLWPQSRLWPNTIL